MTKAYVLPFIVYLVGTAIIGRFGESAYPWLYSLLVFAELILLFWLMRGRGIVNPHLRVLPAVLVGIVGIAIWIGLSELRLEQSLTQHLPKWLQPGSRSSYVPFEHLSLGEAWLFIAIRILGLAVVVPLAEELFWRGFLLRWLIDPEWETVPLGTYTFSSCALVTLLFTLAHPEWIAAAVYCLLLNALLYWRKDLWLCIVAHAVSNLLLGLYVLLFGAWWLW